MIKGEKGQRKFVKWYHVIGGILAIVLLVLMWSGYGGEINLTMKIAITVVFIIAFFISYWFYSHQKKLDGRKINKMVEEQKSGKEKVLSATYKVTGWTWRIKVVGSMIIGILLFLGGIAGAIWAKSFTWLILSLTGLIAIIVGGIMWKRTKSLVKGRFY